LNDEPPIVSVADERRTAVTFAVNETIRGASAAERVSALDGGAKTVSPPRVVEYRPRIPIDHPE
jgi:hypothetical protein